jgi:hypothetical protein
MKPYLSGSYALLAFSHEQKKTDIPLTTKAPGSFKRKEQANKHI